MRMILMLESVHPQMLGARNELSIQTIRMKAVLCPLLLGNPSSLDSIVSWYFEIVQVQQ
jgi:hypothetical protein